MQQERRIEVVKGIDESGIHLGIRDTTQSEMGFKLSLEAVQAMKVIARVLFEEGKETCEIATSIGVVRGKRLSRADCEFGFVSNDGTMSHSVVLERSEIEEIITMMEDPDIKVPLLDDPDGVLHGIVFPR